MKTTTDIQAHSPSTFYPLLLGSGKLARHLHHYFHLKSIPHCHSEDARNLDTAAFESKLERASFVWILTSDRAITEVAEKIRAKKPEVTLVHASGSLSVPGVYTLHPLNTFGPDFYEISVYLKTAFTVITEEWADQPEALVSFFKNVPNPRQEIRAEARAFYHAACVMTSNFPQILWSAVFSEIEKKLGQPSAHFEPLLKQASANFLELRNQSLTGPLVRGDQSTIDRNLQALAGSELLGIYQSFVQFYQSRSNKEEA